MDHEKINEIAGLGAKLSVEDLREAANSLCRMYKRRSREALASSGQSLTSFMVGDRVITNDKGRRIPAGRIGTVSKRGRSRLHVRFDYDPSTVWTVPPSLLLHHTSADMAKAIVKSVTNHHVQSITGAQLGEHLTNALEVAGGEFFVPGARRGADSQ